jgi:hypothetical protein
MLIVNEFAKLILKTYYHRLLNFKCERGKKYVTHYLKLSERYLPANSFKRSLAVPFASLFESMSCNSSE